MLPAPSSLAFALALVVVLLATHGVAARMSSSGGFPKCNYFPGRNYTSAGIIRTVQNVATSYDCCQQCSQEPNGLCQAATYNSNTYECVLVVDKSQFVDDVDGVTGVLNAETPTPTTPTPTTATPTTPHPTSPHTAHPTPFPTPNPPPSGVGYAAVACEKGQKCSNIGSYFWGTSVEDAKNGALAMMDFPSPTVIGTTTADEPCMALAATSNGVGWGWAARASLSDAKTAAMKECKKQNTGCNLRTQGCATYPPAGVSWGAFGLATNGWSEYSANSSTYSTPLSAASSVLKSWKSKHSSHMVIMAIFHTCMAAAQDNGGTTYADEGNSIAIAERNVMSYCHDATSSNGCHVWVSTCVNGYNSVGKQQDHTPRRQSMMATTKKNKTHKKGKA